MGWDYYLGDPNKVTLIKEGDLKTKLGDEFEINKVSNDDKGWVKGFILIEKGDKEEWEFARQDKGYFWSGSTNVGAEDLNRICNKVASKLDWQLSDPQIDDQWYDPL